MNALMCLCVHARARECARVRMERGWLVIGPMRSSDRPVMMIMLYMQKMIWVPYILK